MQNLAQTKRQGKQRQGQGLMLISYEFREGFQMFLFTAEQEAGKQRMAGAKAEQNLVQ